MGSQAQLEALDTPKTISSRALPSDIDPSPQLNKLLRCLGLVGKSAGVLVGFGWLVFNLERQPLPGQRVLPAAWRCRPAALRAGGSAITVIVDREQPPPPRSVPGVWPGWDRPSPGGSVGIPPPTGRRGRPGTTPSRQPSRSLRAGAGRAVPPALGGGAERGAVPSPAAATVLSREHGMRPRLCTGNAWPQCGRDSPRSRGRARSAGTPPHPMEWFAPRPGPASEGKPRPPFCAAARGSGRYAAEPVRVSGTRRSLPWPVSGARRARSGPTRAH